MLIPQIFNREPRCQPIFPICNPPILQFFVEAVAGGMRSEPVDVAGVKMHRPGTLIGKALEPLEKGVGEILVLLSLQ